MSIYQQLSEMSDKFLITVFPFTVNGTSTLKLLDYDNTRIYVAFSWSSTTAAPLVFYPNQKTTQLGYPTLGQANFLELFLEKHKSLCQTSWFVLNNNAGLVNGGIVTINLKIVEGTYEETLKHETSQS
jgi:hypothetical protein